MDDIKFINASKDDGELYAKIIVTSRIDTYGNFMDAETIKRTCDINKYLESFNNIIDDKDIHILFISYNDDIVGVIEYGKPIEYDIFNDSLKFSAEIRTFHILKSYQGKHIGSETLKYVLNDLKKLNYPNVFLFTKKVNNRAINLYQKFGFIKEGYEAELTSDMIPALVMIKDL